MTVNNVNTLAHTRTHTCTHAHTHAHIIKIKISLQHHTLLWTVFLSCSMLHVTLYINFKLGQY